jgi:hypothetical protein
MAWVRAWLCKSQKVQANQKQLFFVMAILDIGSEQNKKFD